MRQARRERGFALEAGYDVSSRQVLGSQQLESDIAAHTELVCAIDVRHRAAADQLFESKQAVEHLPDRRIVPARDALRHVGTLARS
ncbi:MAG: hypothetical protein QM756_30460 [Polyangiaceae bacterium]